MWSASCCTACPRGRDLQPLRPGQQPPGPRGQTDRRPRKRGTGSADCTESFIFTRVCANKTGIKIKIFGRETLPFLRKASIRLFPLSQVLEIKTTRASVLPRAAGTSGAPWRAVGLGGLGPGRGAAASLLQPMSARQECGPRDTSFLPSWKKPSWVFTGNALIFQMAGAGVAQEEGNKRCLCGPHRTCAVTIPELPRFTAECMEMREHPPRRWGQ